MDQDVLSKARDLKALAKRKHVEQLVQLSRSSIYAAIKEGTFPPPVRIGARAVAWRLGDIQQWLEDRPVSGGKA
jgi:prophage regulatory protein